MKPRISNRKTAAMTLVEAVVVIFTIGTLVMFLLPALVGHPHHHSMMNCVNIQKQVGISYRIWADDHNEKYPMEVSIADGGVKELLAGPDAWKTFQVMSNQLNTPKILFCPQDITHARAATNFGDDLKNKISYFIGWDAAVTSANVLLAGDDNFLINNAPVTPGWLELTTNTSIAWEASRHVSVETVGWFFKKKTDSGYLVIGDGSVQELNNSQLLEQIKQTGLAINRLAIP